MCCVFRFLYSFVPPGAVDYMLVMNEAEPNLVFIDSRGVSWFCFCKWRSRLGFSILRMQIPIALTRMSKPIDLKTWYI